MRFFIALEIPPECRQELQEVQQQIKQLIPNVRLTDPDKLHLTIAFVGEQPDSLQNKLTEILKEAAIGIKPFQITPGYLDGFPDLHQACTLWIGVKGDIDKLFVIRERVKDGLISLGLLIEERRYIPHIAIAKPPRDFHLLPYQEAEFETIDLEQFTSFQVSSLRLFESIPEEGFHRHNTLAEISLMG